MTTPHEPSLDQLKCEREALSRELAEAREQQAATTEILRVISSSPSDIQPVLDAVAETAARLCGAHDVVIRLVEGNVHRAVAHYGPIPIVPARVLTRANMAAHAILDGRTVHVPDVAEAYARGEYPEHRALAPGHRSLLAVPLMRKGTAIGVIAMRRQELRPFTDKQIKLLEMFAAQAVIAIENVRLFKETKEALEQQTVISEILRVISSSPTDVQSVFDAVVKSGLPLFGGMEVSLRLVKGEQLETVAHTRPTFDPSTPFRTPLNEEGMPAPRALLRREVVQIPDYLASEEWVSPKFKLNAERGGFRALMSAPLL